MISFQKNGHTFVVPVKLSFMLQLKNTWKVTFGYTPTQVTVLEDGNE